MIVVTGESALYQHRCRLSLSWRSRAAWRPVGDASRASWWIAPRDQFSTLYRPIANAASLLVSELRHGGTLDDPLAKSDDGPPTEPPNEAGSHAWLGRLSTYVASFAGGMAVNDVSGTLGYHGLAGAVALSGVVAAAVWIRGLETNAPLAKHAPRLFLILGGCAAAVAAFGSGVIAAELTALAAVLTVGAVMVTKEVVSATRLLAGAAFIATGGALIAAGATLIADGDALLGSGLVVLGAAAIAGGIAYVTGHGAPFPAAWVAGGAAVITIGVALIADRHVPIGAAIIAAGVAGIAEGTALLLVDYGVLRRLAYFSGGGGFIVAGGAFVGGGVALIVDHHVLAKGTAIAAGAAAIVAGIAVFPLVAGNVTGHYALATAGFITIGAAVITVGAALISDHYVLIGAAVIAFGVAPIGGIAALNARVVRVAYSGLIEWATKAPSETTSRMDQPD